MTALFFIFLAFCVSSVWCVQPSVTLSSGVVLEGTWWLPAEGLKVGKAGVFSDLKNSQ
jgi:hypothetical protein